MIVMNKTPYFTVGVTVAILIKQERNDSLSFLDQIKRIYDYRHPLISKDIFTTPFQTRMNHCVLALINHDIYKSLITPDIIGFQ